MFSMGALPGCGESSLAVVRFAANGLLQSTFLILLGLAVGRAFRGKGAAMQSAVYRLTLATALACPVVSLVLATVGVPGMDLTVRIIPSRLDTRDGAAVTNAKLSPARPAVGVPAATLSREQAGPNSSEPIDGREGLAAAIPAQAAVTGELAPAVFNSTQGTPSSDWPLYWSHALAVAWALGTGLLLARMLSGWRAARLLRRTALPADPETVAHCRILAESLGIRAPQVLRTPFSSSPLLVGVFWPVVLLPEGDDKRTGRDVLAHELAHLARGDAAWRLLGRVGSALWFFQPLVWLVVRRMVASAEEVCDDYVLQFGAHRPSYARRLVEIAEQYCPPPAVGVGMISLRSSVGRRVVRILDSSRQLSLHASRRVLGIAVVASLLATILVGRVGIGPGETDAAAAAPTAQKDRSDGNASGPQSRPPSAASQPTPAQGQNAREITVRGKVLSPTGQPVPGATIRAGAGLWAMLEPIVGPNARLPISEATADADGEFNISFTTQPYGDLSRLDPDWQTIWRTTSIVASAPGYGAVWVEYKELQPETPIALRLVPDLPIKGRVIDAKGKSVAGLTIEVGDIWAARSEDLTPWLDGIKAGQLPWIVVNLAPRQVRPALLGIPERVKTDREGRFEIRGVGRERHLGLAFQGETVAYQQFGVVTRRMEAIERIILGPSHSQPAASKEPVFGADFTVIAAPSHPVTGTVRDAKTGAPLEGVRVESYKMVDYPFVNHRVLKTTTDAQGRYRLVGMPRGKGNEILAQPNDDQPYLMRRLAIADPEGPGPAIADIGLHRGIWITGRVTDKATGQPVKARLHYLPFRSNAFARATPEFGEKFTADGDQMRYQSRADGFYRLVGLPGRAIVGAESVLRQYRVGIGFDRIQGLKDERHFDTYSNPVLPGPMWPNVMKEIDPPAGAESVTVDFQMEPGATVRISVVDPEGRPVRGMKVDGAASSHGRAWTTIDEPTFEVTNLGPEETRTLLLRHEARRLGLMTQIRASRQGSQPIVVRLLPVGTLKGRLLERGGTPVAGANIEAIVLPSRDFGNELAPVTTDGQGRFQYTMLPGANYRLRVEGGNLKVEFVDRDLAVQPNEVRDLGDVRLGRAN